MITYSRAQADNKRIIKELTLAKITPLLIIGALTLALAVYFLIVGHGFSKPEALKMGYGWLAIALLCTALCLAFWLTYRKIILQSFQKYAVDGKLDFTLEGNGESFRVTRLADNFVFSFQKSDIKRMHTLKTLILIQLNDKRLLMLPRRADVAELLDM